MKRNQSHREMSRALKGNPRAKLNWAHEIRNYIRKLQKIRGRSRTQLIDAFSKKIKLRASTRIVVAMPVQVEEPHLTRALLCYVRKNRNLKRIQIVLFINSSRRISSSTYGEHLARRIAEVEAFQKENRQLSLSFFSHQLNQIKMGEVRGLLTDAIVCAAQRARLYHLIIVSNDSDQISISADYFSKIESFFFAPGAPDAARGGGTWGTNRLHQALPELWLNMKLRDARHQLLEGETAKFPTRHMFWGVNSFFRLGIYCAVGGYDYNLKDTEDIDLGCAIENARTLQSDWFYGFFGVGVGDLEHVRVASDPRRILQGLLRGQVVVESASWRDRLPAARFSIEELMKEYHANKKLLQSEDLRACQSGNKKARAKVQKRVREILMRTINKDPFFYPHQLEPLGRAVGIEVRRPKWRIRKRQAPRLLDADLKIDRLISSY